MYAGIGIHLDHELYIPLFGSMITKWCMLAWHVCMLLTDWVQDKGMKVSVFGKLTLLASALVGGLLREDCCLLFY